MKYKNLTVINQATFSDMRCKTLSYKDLPQGKMIQVTGKVDDKFISIIGTLNGKIIFTEDKCYTFVPIEVSVIENAMNLKITKFDVYEDKPIIINNDLKKAINLAKDIMSQGKKVRAEGFLKDEHYRARGSGLLYTSTIKEILEIDGHIFLKTSNSIYCIA